MVQPFRPLPPPDAVGPLRGRGTFEEIVRRAAGDLRGQGWDVVKERFGAADPWHVIGQRGQKLRVVQVVPPAARFLHLPDRREALGVAVALPADQGIMEQWLAHVRPDGHVAFGPYVLSPLRWSRDAAPEEIRRRLGLKRSASRARAS